MSTFSGLNTAYTGLVAAKAGLDVVGQNLVNANTQGYTRQRVTTSGVPALSSAGLFSGGVRPGQGVTVDGIQRLDDAALDARVRTTTALSGYTGTRADALATLEQSLNERGRTACRHSCRSSGRPGAMWPTRRGSRRPRACCSARRGASSPSCRPATGPSTTSEAPSAVRWTAWPPI